MSQADEDAIRELEHRFNAAWNAHDPDGIAKSLADDAQFITVNGAWTASRAGFRDLMQRLHGANGPFRTSTRRTPEMQVRFLTPDVATLHSRFWIDGEILHDELSQPSRESVGTRVVHKRDGQMVGRRDAEHRRPPRPAALTVTFTWQCSLETGVGLTMSHCDARSGA